MKGLLTAFLILGTVLLAGCTAEQRASMGYVTDQIKTVNDTEARLLLQAPCAIDIGPYWRVLNNAERDAVDTLCGK